MSTRNAEAITEVFNRYDTDKIGKISKTQLRSCISDLNGRQIDDAELNNISELAAWSGVTLPVGMLVSSISNAKADGATPAYYSLDGVRYKDEPKSGVYLKVTNGKAIKVVR